MAHVRRALGIFTIVVLAAGATLGLTTGDALACSCMSPDLIRAVEDSDIVFTGTVVSTSGDRSDPVWKVEVDGAIKGDVGSLESVHSENTNGCGPSLTLTPADHPVVIFASEDNTKLSVPECMRVPSVDEFVSQVAALPQGEPEGVGPPAVVALAHSQSVEVALLDQNGIVLTHGPFDYDQRPVAIEHCASTTRAVALTNGPAPNTASIIDLVTGTVVNHLQIDADFWGHDGDQIACLDGGAAVVTASGYAPETNEVQIARSTVDGSISRTFNDVSRGVIHPQGSVVLLPTTVDAPLRVLDAVNLQPVADADYELPPGSSTINGSISPDGSRLAILARLDGIEVAWDSGATHIVVVELHDGLPIGESTDKIELVDPGDTIFTQGRGAVNQIEWIDESTWVVEAETGTNNRLRVVTTDGTQTVDNIFASSGGGLTPLPGGVLRSGNKGLEILRPDGTIDKSLRNQPVRVGQHALLIDVPAFEPADWPDAVPIQIAPVAAGTPTLYDTSSTGWLLPVAAGSAVVGGLGWLAWRRRSGKAGGPPATT